MPLSLMENLQCELFKAHVNKTDIFWKCVGERLYGSGLVAYSGSDRDKNVHMNAPDIIYFSHFFINIVIT